MPQSSQVPWQIRKMAIEEIHRIRELDVSERGGVVYKWVNGRVRAVPEKWERPASYGEGWQGRAESIKASLAKGGTALGAFSGDHLIGFIALRYRIAKDVAQLQALWVSRDYRRQGVAAALTTEAVRLAKDSGATALYVSAMPSESAQEFYRSQGFRPTEFVHRELYEREPEDIHMAKKL